MPDLSTITIALLLTLFAGLSTGIGAMISFFTRHTDTRLLARALGLSAGVMVYISFMELMPQATAGLSTVLPHRWASAAMLGAFFAGIALIALIDWLVPADENPHETHSLSELESGRPHHRRKAFLYSLLSGLAEPAGALIGMLFLLPFWSPVVNAVCLAVVAGIMVYIAFDELLPSAESFGHHHLSLIGVIVGMALMGATLVIL